MTDQEEIEFHVSCAIRAALRHGDPEIYWNLCLSAIWQRWKRTGAFHEADRRAQMAIKRARAKHKSQMTKARNLMVKGTPAEKYL